jgi:hypothetical protein
MPGLPSQEESIYAISISGHGNSDPPALKSICRCFQMGLGSPTNGVSFELFSNSDWSEETGQVSGLG